MEHASPMATARPREQTRYRAILWIETDIPEDLHAEATIGPGTLVDLGDGQRGIVGRVVGVHLGEPLQ